MVLLKIACSAVLNLLGARQRGCNEIFQLKSNTTFQTADDQGGKAQFKNDESA